VLPDGRTMLIFSARTHKDFLGTGAHRHSVFQLIADFKGDQVIFTGEISSTTEDVRRHAKYLYLWVGDKPVYCCYG